jgi:NADH:ubiquinone reductase (H+-translocating)
MDNRCSIFDGQAKMKRSKVVIVGGGFAGLAAAMEMDRTLARRAEMDVTLVSRDNFTLFTPMLHEVASGELDPADIVNPIRRILRHVKFVEAEVHGIDLAEHRVRGASGISRHPVEFEFDHLLLAAGAETNFFELPGLAEWAVTMKTHSDAVLLRNRVLALLEEASLHSDPAARRALLTFVTAGGGFSGVETTGAINDLMHDAVRFYPELREDDIRMLLVHPGEVLLPELGADFGRYAERKLCARKIEVRKGVRVAAYDGTSVALADGTVIPAATLIWTAGVRPSPAIAALPLRKVGGRLAVNEFLAIPDCPGVWAAGDCAAVPDGKTGTLHPPTAQHGLREGRIAAQNISAAIQGQPLRPFTFITLGQLATIGHRAGVARLFGVKFSGFLAWFLWRSIYLMKLPRLAKKLRVMMGWTLDLLFSRDLEQLITLRDVVAVGQWAARIRTRTTQRNLVMPGPEPTGSPATPEDTPPLGKAPSGTST